MLRILTKYFIIFVAVMASATLIAQFLDYSLDHAKADSDPAVDSSPLKIVHQLSRPPNVTGLAWSPDGTKLATFSDYTRLVTIWDASNWHIIREFRRNSNGYGGNAFAWLSNGLILAPATPPEDARFSLSLWDPETGLLVKNIPGPTDEKSLQLDQAAILAVSNDGTLVAIANYRSRYEVFLFDSQTWTIQTTFTLPQSRERRHGAQALSFGSHNDLAVGSTGGVLDIFDIAQRKLIRSIDAYLTDRAITSVAFSPDGASIVTAPSQSIARVPLDGAPVRIWRTDTAECIVKLGGAQVDQTFPQVAWSRDGSLLSAIGFAGVFNVWRVGKDQKSIF